MMQGETALTKTTTSLEVVDRKKNSIHLHEKLKKRARYKVATVAVAAGFMTSGCSATIAGALSFADMSSGLSLVSMAITGKGLVEHTMDAITGKDCRFIEGAFRADREICEERNSVATKDDFKGVVAWLSIDEDDKPAEPAGDTAIAALDDELDGTSGLSAGATIAEADALALGAIEPAVGTIEDPDGAIETVSLHAGPAAKPAPRPLVAEPVKEWTADELAQAALPRLKQMDENRPRPVRLSEAPVQQDLPLDADPVDLAALANIAPAAGTPMQRDDRPDLMRGIEMSMVGTPVAPSALDMPEVASLF